VKHPASTSEAPVAVGVTGSTQAITVANNALFIRGNATGDATTDPLPAPLADPTIEIDLNDGLRVLRYLFVSATLHPIACLEAADANNDVKVNLLDAVYVFQYVFGNAAPFPAPLDHVGTDTDGDAMGCATSQL
jgi:hypothetical protein